MSALAGCAAPGPIFEPLAQPLQWPPNNPRIEYVGALSSRDDLGAPKSLGEVLFGREPVAAMLSPHDVCTDDGERVFVCDSNGKMVHVFDLDTRRYEQWRPAEGETSFEMPVGVAWDPAGQLLVCDSVVGAIFVFSANGDMVGTMGSAHLERPCGVAIDPVSGVIAVADAVAHQVIVLDGRGLLVDRIGTRGIGLGEFNFPTHVAYDDTGNLYVADTLNFRVQVFDSDRRALRQVGSQGDLPGYFSQPKGLDVDSEGHLYVVDAHFETVQAFDDQGRLLISFGSEGHGPAQFWLPAGLHVDARDRIWVTDSYNRRVQVFQYLKEEAP